jgi:outer membrane murein-binding lipoprotein Lpp
MSADGRSRLCPEHRSDSIPSKSCANCAQARRIDELETTVGELAEQIEELESDKDNTQKVETAIPEIDSA